jgi:hypothetical protein
MSDQAGDGTAKDVKRHDPFDKKPWCTYTISIDDIIYGFLVNEDLRINYWSSIYCRRAHRLVGFML